MAQADLGGLLAVGLTQEEACDVAEVDGSSDRTAMATDVLPDEEYQALCG